MAKNSAINLDVTPRADGFSIAGGVTSQELRLSVADAHFIGQVDGAFTLPNSAATNLVAESYATAKGDILAASASNALTRLGVGSNGQVLTADSGEAQGVKWATPASGAWIWTEVTGTSATLVAHEAVIANNAGLVTLTLPATAAVGDEFWVVGKGAGLFRVQAASGDIINLGALSSSASGYIEATQRYDAVRLVCTVANSEFTVSVAPQGNLTVA